MSVGHFDCRKIQVTQIPETFTPPPPSGNINPTVKLPGTDIDVTVASAEDCENVDFVVCVLYNEASASGVPQMESYCMDCKQRVCRDARGPQKPPSICIDCAIKRTPPDNQSLTE